MGLYSLLDNPPSPAPSYAELKKQWMILRDSFFTLDGTECNKIGISYSGFRNQPGDKCHEPFGTCLDQQIKDYWEVSISFNFFMIVYLHYIFSLF